MMIPVQPTLPGLEDWERQVAGEPHAAVTVISFGYGRTGEGDRRVLPPPAHLTLDVRTYFRDLHVAPARRRQTPAGEPVITAVMNTPGVPALIEAAVAAVNAFRAGSTPGAVTVAVGCESGRHTSAVIAAQIARRLGPTATLIHRDIAQVTERSME